MKKIYSANLNPTGTTDIKGDYCEWSWTESSEEEYGHEWKGDVLGYLDNLIPLNGESYDDFLIVPYSDYEGGGIHNVPSDAIVLIYKGEPISIFWCVKNLY